MDGFDRQIRPERARLPLAGHEPAEWFRSARLRNRVHELAVGGDALDDQESRLSRDAVRLDAAWPKRDFGPRNASEASALRAGRDGWEHPGVRRRPRAARFGRRRGQPEVV